MLQVIVHGAHFKTLRCLLPVFLFHQVKDVRPVVHASHQLCRLLGARLVPLQDRLHLRVGLLPPALGGPKRLPN